MPASAKGIPESSPPRLSGFPIGRSGAGLSPRVRRRSPPLSPCVLLRLRRLVPDLLDERVDAPVGLEVLLELEEAGAGEVRAGARRAVDPRLPLPLEIDDEDEERDSDDENEAESRHQLDCEPGGGRLPRIERMSEPPTVPSPGVERPRRSVLYVPGSNTKALAKARTLPCDAVILDLEDSVAPEAKEPARRAVVEAVAAGGFAPRELLVRVNARGTPWHREDLAALARLPVDGIVLPKVETLEDVREAAGVLGASGATAAPALWLTIETPRGVLAADLLAGAHPSVAGLVAGTSDLTKELRARHVPGREPLLHALSAIVLAARAHSLAALDGVHLALEDEEGFATACRQGRDLGFDGKTLIHPRTIEAANRAFAPDPSEVEAARRILAAWEAARAEDRGVVVHDGHLVEELHAREAERLVALAGAIASRTAGG